MRNWVSNLPANIRVWNGDLGARKEIGIWQSETLYSHEIAGWLKYLL